VNVERIGGKEGENEDGKNVGMGVIIVIFFAFENNFI
jgi:hypothetical protein